MKLFIESNLPVDPETAWKLFESEEFEKRLEAQTKISMQLIDETADGESALVRRMKYTSANELPALVGKALGSKHLTYEQTNRMNYSTSRLEWTVKLPVLTDRVSVSGFTSIQAVAGGCRRVVDGDITVKVRLIGGQIEKAVVAEFEKSMTRAVDIVRQMIAEQKLG